jgi:hypothetical protein
MRGDSAVANERPREERRTQGDTARESHQSSKAIIRGLIPRKPPRVARCHELERDGDGGPLTLGRFGLWCFLCHLDPIPLV